MWGVFVGFDWGEVDNVMTMLNIHCISYTRIFVSGDHERCGSKEVTIGHSQGNGYSLGDDGPSYFSIV